MTQMLNVFQVMTDRVAFVGVAGVEMGKHALVSDLSYSFSFGEFGFFCQCSTILFQHLEHFYCRISFYYTCSSSVTCYLKTKLVEHHTYYLLMVQGFAEPDRIFLTFQICNNAYL